MICIYHSKDLDGYCSGAIVKKKYPDAKLIGYDYGQSFPWQDIPTNTPVIMIDVSLPMEDMAKLAYHSDGQLTWIDHHVSAIKAYWEYKESNNLTGIKAVLEDGVSACEGGWKFLFPSQNMPKVVTLLGEYDTWRNKDKQKWDNEIMPCQYGMRMICSSAETFPSNLLHDFEWDNSHNPVNDIIREGHAILKYQKVQNERACKSSFEIEFEGLRAICLNNGGANSQVFESVWDEEKHDVMIPFVFTGKHWTFSLYTTKDEIDCSVIAKSKAEGAIKKRQDFNCPNYLKILN